jgi:hypothetical protein
MDAVDREPKKIAGASEARDIRQGGEGVLVHRRRHFSSVSLSPANSIIVLVVG